ncbi:uncharacterized protein LOC134244483 [Saccostrea cucullata]|uniref:uncharacterized protein LOC134244483 n=1 Tax=Saccostrea cuccullata TaxID=36930 RepID=UPI002ED2E566
MGTILHFHNPRKYSLLQTVISVEMYRSGCNQKIFRWFQKLGWCKGFKGTRTAVDKLCTEFDDSINSWKNDIQVELQGPQPDEHQSPVEDSESSEDSDDSFISESSENQDSSDVEVSSEEEVDAVPLPQDDTSLNDEIENGNQNPGYSVCWDNVQKLSVTRHPLRQDNKMMLWALCFAAKNRISFVTWMMLMAHVL